MILGEDLYKNFVSVILSVLLMISVFAFSANAETMVYGSYEYRIINDRYVELLRCKIYLKYI